MKDIIEQNYISIKKRGLINNSTKPVQFITKLKEEVDEFVEAEIGNLDNRDEELADIILVCLNFAKHYNIDIENELIKKININKKR